MNKQHHAAGKKWKTILGKINRSIICKTHGVTLTFGSAVGSRRLSCGHHHPRRMRTEWKKPGEQNDEGYVEGRLLEKAEELGLLVPRSREAVLFAAVFGLVKSS